MNNNTNTTPVPPIAPKKTTQIRLKNGTIISDDYYWLRDETRSNSDVLNYLKQENEYLEKVFQATGISRLQEEIYNEFLDLESKVEEHFAPWQNGEYWYCRVYKSDTLLKRFKKLTRSEEAIDPKSSTTQKSQEDVVLSVSDLDSPENNLSFFEISPNQHYVAFGFDDKGNERYTLKVKNLITQRIEQIDTIYSVGSIEPWFTCCWSADSRHLFYIALDEHGHSKRVYRHTLGQPPKNDILVYNESDESYVLSLSKTNDAQYIILSCYTSCSNELWYLSSSQPDGKFKRILPRKPNVLYFVDHHSGYFYVGTNERGINSEIIQIPVELLEQQQQQQQAEQNNFEMKDDRRLGQWRVVLPHDNSIQRINLTCFRNYIIVYEQSQCKKQIRVVELNPLHQFSCDSSESVESIHKSLTFDRNFHHISLSEEVYTLAPGNIDDNYTYVYREKAFCPYQSDSFVFSYTSFITPKTIIEYDMRTHTQRIQWQQKIKGYNPNEYHSERLFAPSFDGVLIPISLVWRKDLRVEGKPSPLVISGYGGYGASKDARFSLYKLSLLNRGVIIAIAHVRGGNEMGKLWHVAGKLLNKKNSFQDLIACCEYLIEKKYTDTSLLAIRGRSAGGLLVCATAILRPSLMKTVIAEVPFVDVILTMSDPSIPWVAFEYDEWGDPNDPKYFDYMKEYCPITNIQRTAYPNFLVTTGFQDVRVQFWEPAKFVAKLRAYKTDNNFLFLKTYFDGGHFARDRSLMWAFLVATLKLHTQQ